MEELLPHIYGPWDLEMKKYEENMKNYEGISLLIYRAWDLEKFRGWGSQDLGRGSILTCFMFYAPLGNIRICEYIPSTHTPSP